MGDQPGSVKTVTANICVGCCDMRKEDDPNKAHYCQTADDFNLKHGKDKRQGYVDPVITTYPQGGKCRDVICPVRQKAISKKAA